MLEVIFYKSTNDIAQKKNLDINPLIICPSPLIADSLRRLFVEETEVITISKWIGDILKSKKLEKINKSELMLRLSSVWRHYFPNEEAHLFFKSFELFTELRSFSLNLELLADFQKELDDVISKSIIIFWTFIENENLIDEHLSYQVVCDARINRQVWFIGFKHLSGVQIDMLKTLGELDEIKIFFPKYVYRETLPNDWIRWIEPSRELDNDRKLSELKVIHFPKSKLNLSLQALSESKSPFHITIANSNLTLSSYQELHLDNSFFKTARDLFLVARVSLMEELSLKIGSGVLEIDLFIQEVEEIKKASLAVGDYLKYKCTLLLDEAIKIYQEFQSSVDAFAIKVFAQILELNSPRISAVTLEKEEQSRVFDFNEMSYNQSELPIVFIASSDHGSLKSQESKHSDKMLEALRLIGPQKRAGLDFSFLKNDIIQFLSEEKNLLLIEEGLEHIDLSWREILNEFSLSNFEITPNYGLKKAKDYLLARITPGPYPLTSISASKMQCFVDCPRKYYFSYIEKTDHRPKQRLEFSADEMGVLEHEIIQAYFFQCSNWKEGIIDLKRCEEIVENVMAKFLAKHSLVISKKTRQIAFYELLHHSQNGILFLLDFLLKYKALDIKFEVKIPPNPMSIVGSIDCLIFLPEKKVALFDFKRSSAAIGSKKETILFEKIQIWVYLIALIKFMGKEVEIWGYLNLSDIDDSLIFDESEKFKLEQGHVDYFFSIIDLIIERMKSEINYKASPKNANVCDFCEVSLFCNKGAVT